MSLIVDLIDNAANKSSSKAAAVLGSSARVKQLVAFYRNDNNKKSLQLIMANGLLDFCQSENFTPEELGCFKKGLSIILEFMVEAQKEVDQAENTA